MTPDDSGPIYHVQTHPSGAEFWRHVIEIVAFVVAAGWAFYVFIYQERIKPAQTPAQLQFNVTISHQPVHSGAEFVDLTVEVRNVGTVPLRVAGWAIAAYGYRYLPRLTQTLVTGINRNGTTLSRSLAESRPDLLNSTYVKFAPFGASQPAFVMRPGGDAKVHGGFGIPRNKYDAIFLKYKYCFASSDNTHVYDPRPYRDSTGAYWFGFIRHPNGPPSERITCGLLSRDDFPL